MLWTFVILMAIGVGAGLYEARVISPLWSGSPPESVWGWRDLFAANPRYAPHGGDRFWIFVSPARALLAVLLLVSAVRTWGRQRNWRITAGVLALAQFAMAALWLIPMSVALFAAEPTLAPDEVTAVAGRYVMLNYVFQGVGLAAFFAGLRALSLEAIPRDA